MNIATLITASRVAVAPIFAYVFIRGYRTLDCDDGGWIYICLALAVLIELSDLLDGTVARARGEVTDFGKVFDPIADSVSRQTVFISFMIVGIIPLWMYLIFFYRDAFMQLLRIVCASSGVVLAARVSGKIKAVLQGVATFAVLGVVWAEQSVIGEWIPNAIWGRPPGFWIMLVTAIYTLLSVIDYIVPNRSLIADMMKKRG
ncbi:MAG: CDP-alcohol phosphatidyltransferase family protein [Chitinispirillales bacterium]|jgi:CDP-diacylglycerol--glycerol-3-phosphate 3-phosphatidyltransferase|nr:CDP-alcohol phosphatidyltransferase family protein [Chitinispirillales bacterium]